MRKSEIQGRKSSARNVTRRIPSREHSARRQEAQAPVPAVSCTTAVVVLGENPLRALEAVGLRDTDGEPDDGKDKVDSDDTGGSFEHPGVVASWGEERMSCEKVEKGEEKENERESKFEAMATTRKTSETIHWTARNLMLVSSSPPGK